MSILNKSTLSHLLPGIVIVLVALLLFLFPENLLGKLPYVVEHEQAKRSAVVTTNSPAYSRARENLRQADRELERAKRDLLNARVPVAGFQSASRYDRINRAHARLNRAKEVQRQADNDVYWAKTRLYYEKALAPSP